MFELALPIVLAAFNIGKWLTFGLLLVLGAAIVGYFFPPLRRLAAELAIVFAFGTYLYGWGIADERKLWLAREDKAAEEAAARDEQQGELAGADEHKSLAELEAQIKRDKEQIDALRKADASCHPISADQLR